jgi:hypothetical protein
MADFNVSTAKFTTSIDVTGASIIGMNPTAYIATGAGTANAITGAFNTPVVALVNGMPLRVRGLLANTITNPTFQADTTAAKTIVKGNNLPLTFGDISGPGHWLELEYDSTLDVYVLQNPATGIASTIPRTHLSGLTMSSPGSIITLSISAGQAVDSTNSVIMNFAGSSKTTAIWALGAAVGGLDTGTIAINTWYHFYIIRRPDTGVLDCIFSLSGVSPTLPAGYTQFRRIGFALTNGSSQWIGFSQRGDEFLLTSSVLIYSTSSVPTSPTLITAAIAGGVKSLLILNGYTYHASLSAQVSISSPDGGANGGGAGILYGIVPGGTLYGTVAGSPVRTNTSSQISIVSNSASQSLSLYLNGWIDSRGKEL